MSTVRAVLFDLDDTLVDHRSAADAAVRAWAVEHGIGGADVASRWSRVADRHYARYQRCELTFQEQRRARVREFLGRELTDEESDRVFAGYLQRYEAGWRAYPDARAALSRVREAGLTCAVFTNGDEEQQRRKLEFVGLTDLVDSLVASSTLPAGKPDPRAFAAALDRLDVPPEEALMVGDSLDKDVLGARAAGLGAVLLDREDRHTGAAVPRITSLDELLLATI